MESAPAPETLFDGRLCLYFGGTSYYGLHGHPDLIEAGLHAWHQFGHSTATSRAGMGNTSLYQQVERAAADFFGAESAAYLPSGYLSNLVGLRALRDAGEFDVIFVDEHSHYSVIDAALATGVTTHTVAHMDPDGLRAGLRKHLQPGEIPLMISDGAFPALGEIAPVPEHVEILEAYNGLLWLDDAHPVGILGPNGRGSYDHFGLTGDRLLFGGTLAKAFGGFGGVIAGPASLIEGVMRGGVFGGASAVPPPLAAATLSGIRLVKENPQWRERLWANARQIKSGIRDLGFEVEQNDLPIVAFSLGCSKSMVQVQQELMGRGIAIQYAHYPGAGDQGVLRAVVFSTHSGDQIKQLIDELRELL